MNADLRTALGSTLAGVTPPPGDVDRARREGTRIRRRRRTAGAVSGVALVVAVAVAVSLVLGGTPGRHVGTDYAGVGELDFSQGLRAYADPGREIHLGGRTFDASELEYLDTDATATPFGVVFYDQGRPMLLDETGDVSALTKESVDADPGFHPTAKTDSARPLVAWATLRDGVATVSVRDMASGEDVDSLDVDCGACRGLVIDALDDGVVFFRTGDETRVWKPGHDDFSFAFAGGDTRVVDVRNGTMLYDGPAPTSLDSERYLLIPAPVDAQLTFDGRYILDWSSRLAATRTSNDPLRLDAGPVKGLGFWAIDTDGSVLVASVDGKYPNYLVSDCEVPSGRCVEVGPLKATGGDPLFIGNDM